MASLGPVLYQNREKPLGKRNSPSLQMPTHIRNHRSKLWQKRWLHAMTCHNQPRPQETKLSCHNVDHEQGHSAPMTCPLVVCDFQNRTLHVETPTFQGRPSNAPQQLQLPSLRLGLASPAVSLHFGWPVLTWLQGTKA